MRNEVVESGIPESLAPVLGARRDGSANADSSRGLLMTVLGEFVLPVGGSAWTRTLVAALGLLDVQEKAARQAIARMEGDGWLERERIGRQTRWTLTAHAQTLLEDGAERIYGFGRGDRPWSGDWVLLLASVPESERAARYRMTQRLSWIGFGSLGQGTWISPWATQEAAAKTVLAELGVDATSFRGPLGDIGSADDVARRAWPLDDLDAAYRRFLDDFPVPIPTASPAAAAAETARLVHRWRRFPFLDPDLPAQLLPADWPGRTAADRFATVRSDHHEAARRWWHELENGP